MKHRDVPSPPFALLVLWQLSSLALVGRSGGLWAHERARQAIDAALLDRFCGGRRRQVLVQRPRILARDMFVGNCVNNHPLLASERPADFDFIS